MHKLSQNLLFLAGDDPTKEEVSLLGDIGVSVIGTPSNTNPTNTDIFADILGMGNDSTIGITPNVGLTGAPAAPNAGGGLLELLGDLDMSAGSGANPIQPMGSSGINPLQSQIPTNNALLDGLVLNNNGIQTSTPAVAPSVGLGGNSLDNLFSGGLPQNVSGSSNLITSSSGLPGSGIPGSGIPNYVGYDKNDISITFRFDRPTPSGLIVMNLNIVNNSSVLVTDFYLQAAPPRSMTIEISAASSTTIEPNGGAIQQAIKLNNPQKAELKLLLKVSCKKGGVPIDDKQKVDNFPAELNSS